MVNLPIKGDGETLLCLPDKINGGFELLNSNGYRIAYIRGTAAGQAKTIERLITEARDQGFDQGLASIRKALGCKE
jgi:hypothetical protein